MKKILFLIIITFSACGRTYDYEGTKQFYEENYDNFIDIIDFFNKYDKSNWTILQYPFLIIDSTQISLYCFHERNKFNFKKNVNYFDIVKFIENNKILENYQHVNSDSLNESFAKILLFMINKNVQSITNGRYFGKDIISIGLRSNEYILFSDSPKNFDFGNLKNDEFREIEKGVYYYFYPAAMPF